MSSHLIRVNTFSETAQKYEDAFCLTVDDLGREKVLAYFQDKIPVEGFYQYVITKSNGEKFVGYTVNPDVLGIMNANRNSK